MHPAAEAPVATSRFPAGLRRPALRTSCHALYHVEDLEWPPAHGPPPRWSSVTKRRTDSESRPRAVIRQRLHRRATERATQSTAHHRTGRCSRRCRLRTSGIKTRSSESRRTTDQRRRSRASDEVSSVDGRVHEPSPAVRDDSSENCPRTAPVLRPRSPARQVSEALVG
jgi:hypothetical protein